MKMWCYRKIVRIQVVQIKLRKDFKRGFVKIQEKLQFYSDKEGRKLEYAGHALRGSSDLLDLNILEDKVCRRRPIGRPRRILMDDITNKL